MHKQSVRVRKWARIGLGLVMAGMLGACAGVAAEQTGSPEETVTGFYEWYTTFEGSLLGGRGYRESEHLSPAFIEKLDALVDSFESQGGGFDPFICAQDRPAEITVVEVTGTGEEAQVIVQAWNPIQVDVAMEDWEWKRASSYKRGGRFR